MAGNSDKRVEPHVIPLEFFSRKTNRTTQLIENISDEKSLDGRNRWYEFELEKPVYAREISVLSEGYSTWDEIEFEVSHLDGTHHRQKIKFSSNSSSLELGKLISSFRFRPDAKWLSNTKIKKVSLVGLTLEEFHAYEWAIKEFEARIASLSEKEDKAEGLAEKIVELERQKASLDGEIGQAKGQLAKLEQSVLSTQNSLDSEKSNREDTKQEVNNLREQRRKLNEDVLTAENRLHELTKEVRLFPSEIAGFVKEGNRNILWYVGISIPFIIVIYIVLEALFSSAIDLTQLWREEDGVDIWTVFLTRIPFVIVALAILEVCGYVVGRLVFEIIKINRQRLSLSKLSIIAKDVSTASAHNLELSDEELYQKETELKMQLLREHMKEYVGEDFSYKGTAIQSAIASVVGKLTKDSDS